MRKLRGLLEKIHKWPAKCENRECFLLNKFSIIWYITMLLQNEDPSVKKNGPLKRIGKAISQSKNTLTRSGE